ncbi:hypothetical protein GCM10009839_46420 [Catenulispora yoronensis]|uniref:Uncharacterized protein n=1 Tax=Catenulispora yoronensis TaxID=450799 RepID=A0ABP5G2V0_9ACTN
MTATAEPTTDRTAALTGALTEQGWTYTREPYAEPQFRIQVHPLDSPDGRLHIDASRHRDDGFMIARLSAEAVRTDPGRRPGWMVELHEVPLPVALAAVKAADPDHRPASAAEIAAALTADGWTQREDITERGRLLERAWDSPDCTSNLSHLPGDKFESGYWLVSRPGPDGKNAESQISQYTPAAVITTLALTD